MILAGRPDPMSNLSIVSLFYGSSVFSLFACAVPDLHT